MFVFRRLRTRLTVLYAALFAIAMLVVSLAVYSAISTNVTTVVRGELAVSGTVFDRLWAMRNLQLTNGAGLLSRDFGFREAIATQDEATIVSALENLKVRLDIDAAYLIRTDGVVVGKRDRVSIEPATVAALQQDALARGVVILNGAPYEAVSVPIRAPVTMGWVVFASRIDTSQMRGLERLSAIPLDAQILVHGPTGAWRAPGRDHDEPAAIGRLVDRQLSEGSRPTLLHTPQGPALALVHRLEGIQPDQPAVILLTYPLARAIAPYQPLLVAILLVALFGVALVVAGSWILARGVTQPLSSLEDAAGRLQRGEDARVDIEGEDEVANLASGFNAMAQGIIERERRIGHLATHDFESGLPNLYALEQRLRAMSHDGDWPVLVTAIGVDRFESVRSAIGHGPMGALVGEIGRRVAALRPQAFVGRLSGGELGILVRLAPAEESEAALALKEAVALQNVIDEPVQLDGAAIDVSLTSGFIVHHDGAEGAGEAIERASIALIQARRRSLKAAAFDAADYGDPTANLMLMAELRRALKEGEVVVHYQPKLDLHSGAFSGAEALVRWRHPTRGLIRPDLFIPMAEETGHIRPLTLWVLDVVADDRRTASAAGYDLRFSVNISGRLLGDEEFARSLESKIGDEIAGLCFEVTETAVIEQPERGLAALERFAASGVEISLDDYGVGLSSLAYLKSIRAHELKIDKSFVLGLGGDPRETLLVRSTINLGHDLGLKVTAEGVEDAETLAALRAMGCDMAQGFFFARAMALDELLNFLNKSSVTFLGDN